MFELNEIDKIQLDNLICQRVPFVFFQIEMDESKNYRGLEKMHIQQWSYLFDSNSRVQHLALIFLNERQIAKEFPIVIQGQDQEKVNGLKLHLSNLGYQNVFSVRHDFVA